MVAFLTLLVIVIGVGLATCYLIRHPIKTLKKIMKGLVVLLVGSIVCFLVIFGLAYLA